MRGETRRSSAPSAMAYLEGVVVPMCFIEGQEMIEEQKLDAAVKNAKEVDDLT
jgi:hypothetical protein